MHCYVYASLRKADSYLWLARRDAFDLLPADLAALLGQLRFALEVDLDEHRRLPLEDARHVLANLRERGWHLQLPPTDGLAGHQPDYHRGPRGDSTH
ncbi:YcgL domain-containing protein [Dyella lutea]|uniref:YcgL domain-containing protein n=1 Tax=Dyella lutea TaxID=2950441 RepID=A0ABT1F561_9GAMM|nr:YcgL domain-containing protein [Dyella lutea]MCP1372472.1 YcgL domain-containing protein [Dyella lutea]